MDFKKISEDFNLGIKGLKLKTQKGGSVESGEDIASGEISPEWDKFKKDLDKLIADYIAAHPERKDGATQMKKSILENKSLRPVINRGELDFSEIILNWAKSKSSKRKDEFVEFLNKNKNESQGIDDNSSEKDGDNIGDNSDADKIGGVEDEIARLKNEIDSSKSGLGRIKKGSKKEEKILERVKLQEEQLGRLEFERDMLTGEDIESVSDLMGKSGRIKKIVKKNGMATVVDSGEIFEVSLKNNPKKGEQIFFESTAGGIKNTSRVANIKKCADGSCIIETDTSYYRLWVDEDKNENQAAEVKLTPEDEKVAEERLIGDLMLLYKAERDKQGWTGYSKEVEDFLKNNFFGIANDFDLFDQDDEKIKLAWEFIVSKVPTSIEEIENEIKQEAEVQEVTVEDEGKKVEDPIERINRISGNDDDINNFFNLKKEERDKLMELDDIELNNKLEELRAERFEGDTLEREELLIEIGNKMRDKRNIYLQKKVEVEKLTTKLSRFFGKDKKIKYEAIEEELEFLRKDYRETMEEYSRAFAQMEGYYDKEDFEIILRYLNFSERLNLINEELDIKTESQPDLLEKTTGIFEKVASSYLVFYKKTSTFLSQKATEMVSKHTDSKVLKIAGGLSGAMAFGVGISNIAKTTGAPYWAAKAVLLATSTAAITLDNKEKLDQEFEIKEQEEAVARFDEAWNEINNALDAKLDEVIEKTLLKSANDSLDKNEASKKENRDRWKEAFLKAAGKNLFFFAAGYGVAEMMRDFAGYFYDATESQETGNVPEKTIVENTPNVSEKGAVDLPKVEESPINPGGQINGHGVHSGPVVPDNTPEVSGNLGKGDIDTKGLANFLESEKISEDIKTENFEGVELNEASQAEIAVIAKTGIKDSLAKLLIDNHDKLTEGKMGWNPDKYASIEEWADKRAIGIVGELKNQYPDYNFDKVSTETRFLVDLSNKADIKIVGFEDVQNLGGESEIIKELEEKIDSNEKLEEGLISEIEEQTPEKKIEADKFREEVINELQKNDPDFNVDESIEEIREEVNRVATEKEMGFAQKLGFTPEEYSELNNITINDLEQLKDSPNSDSSNVQLKRVFDYLDKKDDFVLDKSQTISEVVRNMDNSAMEEVLNKENGILTQGFEPVTEKLNVADFYAKFINTELPELMRDKTNLGVIFRAINTLGRESVGSQPVDGIFNSFREVFGKSVGDFSYNTDGNVRMYVLKAMGKAYEIGKLDEFKNALKEININKN